MIRNGRIKQRKKLRERRRERRKKLFKGLGRLTLILSFIVGLALAGKKVEDFLRSSPIFQIKEVNFKGATYLEQGVLENLANIKLGENIFQINLKKVQERLERHPKVREALVSRGFPNAVTVDIVEREAVALFESAGGIYPIDGEGVVLPRPGQANPLSRSLPLITGVKPHPTAGGMYEVKVGEKLQWPELTLVLDLLETLTSSDLKISEVDLQPQGPVLRYRETSVLLGELSKSGTFLRSTSQAAGYSKKMWDKERKVKELKLILSDLAERKEEAEYIDLRFTRPVVKLK
ncbi:FtsQ-type POTRA domain-containing protein [candidate division NPL-UPA2 bacterium]|nr:FtsQ-type POTRA domain-containing protein [candidate division NPL-UPA2 bacterium]